LALFVNACGKSDAPDNREYVVKEIYYDDVLRSSFEYNSNWQVTTSTYNFAVGPHDWARQTTSYTYNSDGQLVKTEMVNTVVNSPKLNDVRTEYTYNSQGQLFQAKAYKLNTGELLYADEYTYNGQTIVQTHSIPSGVGYKATVMLDNSGNIVERVETKDTSSTPYLTEKWLNYDDKKNIAGPNAGTTVSEFIKPIIGGVMSKNNFRRYSAHYHDPIMVGPDETSCEYSYSQAGYVINRKTIRSTIVDNIKFVLIPKE
jgi:hypothetical protein